MITSCARPPQYAPAPYKVVTRYTSCTHMEPSQ